jgi:hypothetical protein
VKAHGGYFESPSAGAGIVSLAVSLAAGSAAASSVAGVSGAAAVSWLAAGASSSAAIAWAPAPSARVVSTASANLFMVTSGFVEDEAAIDWAALIRTCGSEPPIALPPIAFRMPEVSLNPLKDLGNGERGHWAHRGA